VTAGIPAAVATSPRTASALRQQDDGSAVAADPAGDDDEPGDQDGERAAEQRDGGLALRRGLGRQLDGHAEPDDGRVHHQVPVAVGEAAHLRGPPAAQRAVDRRLVE